ncbi:MAG: hypothetical protein ABI718_17040 [Acidobacteriota bacterium]
MSKEPTAHNQVLGAVKFEQKGIARLKCLKFPIPTGLPEVNFVELRLAPQQQKPVAVRDSNEDLHEK